MKQFFMAIILTLALGICAQAQQWQAKGETDNFRCIDAKILKVARDLMIKELMSTLEFRATISAAKSDQSDDPPRLTIKDVITDQDYDRTKVCHTTIAVHIAMLNGQVVNHEHQYPFKIQLLDESNNEFILTDIGQ